MADDSRPGAAMVLRFRHKRRHATGVIDVAMGVYRGMEAVGSKLSHHRDGLGLIEKSTRINQNETLFGLDRDNVGEPSVKHNPGRHFLEFTGRYQRMLGSDGQVAVPEFLGLLSDCAHDFQSIIDLRGTVSKLASNQPLFGLDRHGNSRIGGNSIRRLDL
jgi:hypothetical protein